MTVKHDPLAKNMPAPMPVSDEEMRRATNEARALRAKMDRLVGGMETMPENVQLH